MEKESCLNCKYGSHKCKEPLSPSGWIVYCDYYEFNQDSICPCEHYKKDGRK